MLADVHTALRELLPSRVSNNLLFIARNVPQEARSIAGAARRARASSRKLVGHRGSRIPTTVTPRPLPAPPTRALPFMT